MAVAGLVIPFNELTASLEFKARSMDEWVAEMEAFALVKLRKR